MPTPTLIIGTVLIAAVATAAAAMFALAVTRNTESQRAAAWPWLLSVAVGLIAGVAWMGIAVHWPPREDQDRLLLIVWPTFMAAEIVSSIFSSRRWLAFLLRSAAAMAALPTLLWGTVYLVELAGPGTREWSTLQIVAHVVGAGAVLTGVACGLSVLAQRDHARSVLAGVSAAVIGSSLIVMLSGYASGGQLGFPLLGSLVAIGIASLLTRRIDALGAIRFGVVACGALLIVGIFFGKLPMSHAAAMFIGLLLGWLAELPSLRRWNAHVSDGLRIVLMVTPTIAVLVFAQQRFVTDSGYSY